MLHSIAGVLILHKRGVDGRKALIRVMHIDAVAAEQLIRRGGLLSGVLTAKAAATAHAAG